MVKEEDALIEWDERKVWALEETVEKKDWGERKIKFK